MKCLSCGIEKDLDKLETYPYCEDNLTNECPISPLLTVECKGDCWKMAIMCHECWHHLSENTQGIDMWISQSCWETLNPVTHFSSLPNVKQEGKWDAKTYDEGSMIGKEIIGRLEEFADKLERGEPIEVTRVSVTDGEFKHDKGFLHE